jgi:hypothetical protein
MGDRADIDGGTRFRWRCVIGLLWSGRKIIGRNMAQGGGIWGCVAFPFFCPRLFCPLDVRASFVRVGDGFDQPPPVSPPQPSRLFFLLTCGRRHSASVSEILNVPPCDQCLSTDVRHPFRIRNPDTRIQGRRTRGSEPPGSEIPGVENLGSRTSGAKKFWACSPRDRVEPTEVSSNTTSSGLNGCLSAYRPGTDACQVSRRAV